jgi:hypothetical protein
MIFTGFKRKSNQFFLKKQLPKLLENAFISSSDKVENVLVFLDDISKKEEIEHGLKKIVGLPEAKIKLLIFQRKKNKNNNFKGFYAPQDFGWNGNIKSDELNEILTNKYDLLINYSKVENIYTNLLLLQCKIAFRIGFAHFDKRFYDLLIDCDPFDIELYNKEIKKYLAILNKI